MPALPSPPNPIRVVVLIDGQNLYYAAKTAWGYGYHWPNYDPLLLARALTNLERGRQLVGVYFYTGVPSTQQDARWNAWWTHKIRRLRQDGIHVYTGAINVGHQEKGVDVRLAIDLIRLSYEYAFDTAMIVSQDRDFIEAVKLAQRIFTENKRWVSFESAFPVGPGTHNRRGLGGTIWRPLDQTFYDRCLDPTDYRPRKGRP